MWWGIVATILIALIWLAKQQNQWKPGALANNATNEGPHRLHGDGGFHQEIVGESFHRDDIAKLVKMRVFDSDNEADAVLYCEPNNPYDPNAVSVSIRGIDVGHLSRADAPKFRKRILEMGGDTACVRCRVFGGTKDKRDFGIWLDV